MWYLTFRLEETTVRIHAESRMDIYSFGQDLVSMDCGRLKLKYITARLFFNQCVSSSPMHPRLLVAMIIQRGMGEKDITFSGRIRILGILATRGDSLSNLKCEGTWITAQSVLDSQ
jgi:hypothetical protein